MALHPPTQQQIERAQARGHLSYGRGWIAGGSVFVVVGLVGWSFDIFLEMERTTTLLWSEAFALDIDSGRKFDGELNGLLDVLMKVLWLLFGGVFGGVLVTLLQTRFHFSFALKGSTRGLFLGGSSFGDFILQEQLPRWMGFGGALVLLFGGMVSFWGGRYNLGEWMSLPLREGLERGWSWGLRGVMLLLGMSIILGIFERALSHILYLWSLQMDDWEVRQDHRSGQASPLTTQRREASGASLAQAIKIRPEQVVIALLDPAAGILISIAYDPPNIKAPFLAGCGRNEHLGEMLQKFLLEGVPVVEVSTMPALISLEVPLGCPVPKRFFEPLAKLIQAHPERLF